MLRKILILVLMLGANSEAQNEFDNPALYFETSTNGMTWVEAVQVCFDPFFLSLANLDIFILFL